MANKCKNCPNLQNEYPFVGDECVDCYQDRVNRQQSPIGRVARAAREAYRNAQDRKDERYARREMGSRDSGE